MKSYKFFLAVRQTEQFGLEKLRLQAITSEYFTNYIQYDSVNIFNGLAEKSCIIETIQDNISHDTIMEYCEKLKNIFKQDGVLVTTQNLNSVELN